MSIKLLLAKLANPKMKVERFSDGIWMFSTRDKSRVVTAQSYDAAKNYIAMMKSLERGSKNNGTNES